jgi:hypothetical protein
MLAAQSSSSYEIGLHAGSLSHSLLGLVSGTLVMVGPNGLYVEADVEAEPSTLLGGQIERRLAPSVTVRLRLGRASTHMRLVALTQPIGGTGTQPFTFEGLGEVVVWLGDIDISWVPWRPTWWLAPYLFGGVGLSNWDISGLEDLGSLPPLLESPVTLSPISAFLPGAVAGVGLELGPMGPLTLHLEAADHATGDPIADDDFHIGAEFAGHGRAKDLVHNVTLIVGLRVALSR